jgi:hypothetical protein
MAVGFPVKDDYATGDVLTAANMNDFAGTLNTVPSTIGAYAAAKNKFINGDFRISQRGTTFTIGASGYVMDRFFYGVLGSTPTGTISQQTFTPGTAPVAGYEGSNFARINQTADNGCTQINFRQRIEDVRTFAGQTVTFSFWAKADAACNLTSVSATQNFGSGGSASVSTTVTLNSVALTTAWTRYTGTVAIPSISGSTIGSASFLELRINLPVSGALSRNGTYDFWGWQLEAGSIATPFQTATGTIQGELAAAQRYYQFVGGVANRFPFTQGYNAAGAVDSASFSFPVQMRVSPTGTVNGTWEVTNCTQPIVEWINTQGYALRATVTALGNFFYYPNSTDDTITFSAEL